MRRVRRSRRVCRVFPPRGAPRRSACAPAPTSPRKNSCASCCPCPRGAPGPCATRRAGTRRGPRAAPPRRRTANAEAKPSSSQARQKSLPALRTRTRTLAHVPVAQSKKPGTVGDRSDRVQDGAHEARVPEVGDAADAARDAQRVHAREGDRSAATPCRFELRIAQRKKKGRVFFLFVRGGVLRGRAARARTASRARLFAGRTSASRGARGVSGVRGGRFHERSVFASSQNAARAEHGSVEVPSCTRARRTARRRAGRGGHLARSRVGRNFRFGFGSRGRPGPSPCPCRARAPRASGARTEARRGEERRGLRALARWAPRQRRRVSLPSRDAKNAETCEHSVSRPTRVAARRDASRPCETSPGPAGDGAVGTATSIAPDIAQAPARSRATPSAVAASPSRRPRERGVRRPISKKIGRAGIGGDGIGEDTEISHILRAYCATLFYYRRGRRVVTPEPAAITGDGRPVVSDAHRVSRVTAFSAHRSSASSRPPRERCTPT